jgi:hypothetical protein
MREAKTDFMRLKRKRELLQAERAVTIACAQCRNEFWNRRAREIQEYADKHDYGSMFKEINKARLTRKVRQSVTPNLPDFREYFQQLLTVQANVGGDIQSYLPPPRIIAEELASPFTMMELEAALVKMKDSAAPGEDGIQPKLTNMGGRT